MKWSDFFDNYGIKLVTKTDKSKNAYVINEEQKFAIEATGIHAAAGQKLAIAVLYEELDKSVEASYYFAERSQKTPRPFEARMGQAFISSWLQEGDKLLIGNVKDKLFALKIYPGMDESDLVVGMARHSPASILHKALEATGKPAKRKVTRKDYVRNPVIVQAALLRASGRCEMTGCKTQLFLREEGVPYLEVHHVIPLAEEGDDTLANAAALCPKCHREQHYGKLKDEKRAQLMGIVAAKMTALR